MQTEEEKRRETRVFSDKPYLLIYKQALPIPMPMPIPCLAMLPCVGLVLIIVLTWLKV
jgi:hypothetical protein